MKKEPFISPSQDLSPEFDKSPPKDVKIHLRFLIYPS